MKTRIFILICCMITSFGVIFPDATSLKAGEVVSSTSELPSAQYMNSEGYIFNRGSASARENSISLYAEPLAAGQDWEDPWGGEDGWDDGTGAGNVGAPIGDVTPLVVILLILGYSIFRSVSVSKRKNL